MFNGKSQFVTSQNFQNVTGKSQLSQHFWCMFKSHQLCFCHICEIQYLSVITMNSIILQFVKKGTTTWCSITQQNTNSLLGSADYNTCMIQYTYDEYWKRVKMLHCPHASGCEWTLVLPGTGSVSYFQVYYCKAGYGSEIYVWSTWSSESVSVGLHLKSIIEMLTSPSQLFNCLTPVHSPPLPSFIYF